MAIERFLAVALVSAAATVCAQVPVEDPDRVEETVYAPPAYSVNKLIPIEMPPYVTLKIGVDPDTIVVGDDGVARYVVVMRNAYGSVNAAYEGISCANGEVKTYARTLSAGQWALIEHPKWRDLTDNLPSRHALALAKQGVCEGRVAANRLDIINTLIRGQKPY